MNQAEQKAIIRLFSVTALYYDQEIPDTVLKLYVKDVEDLEFTDVERALNELRRSPKQLKCPTPAQVRAHLQPQASEADKAMLAASEIVEAISRVGYYGSPELSPLAKEIVRREGGWQNVCQAITSNEQVPFYRAQWRDVAKAVLAGHHAPDSSKAIGHEGVKLLAGSIGGKLDKA